MGSLHESFVNGAGYIPLANVPSDWNIIALGFADSTGGGNVMFNRCPASQCTNIESDADFKAAIKAKQAAGKKVIISIGGANGEVTLNSSGDVTNFVNSVGNIIDTWGLDGVDLDFENQSLSLNAGDTDFKNPTTRTSSTSSAR